MEDKNWFGQNRIWKGFLSCGLVKTKFHLWTS